MITTVFGTGETYAKEALSLILLRCRIRASEQVHSSRLTKAIFVSPSTISESFIA